MSTVDERISEAEEALHQLSLGKQIVEISRGGKALKYTATSRVDLELYIAQLKATKPGVRRRPMRVYV